MGIMQFELFHGAVLTKLVRSDRPVTLLSFAKPRVPAEWRLRYTLARGGMLA